MIINGWRDVIGLPIISKEDKSWNLYEFENLLLLAVYNSVIQNIEDNNGIVHTTLSGGLDSSFCVSLIRKMFPDVPIHTYTMGGTKTHPDIICARVVSKIFGTVHHELIPNFKEKIEAVKLISSLSFTDRELVTAVLYKFICSESHPRSIIAHDGIDELLGGYPDHRWKKNKRKSFKYFWKRLAPDHLVPLETISGNFGISLIFPYLQFDLVKYISSLDINLRTNNRISKIQLRLIAIKYDLPAEIVNRGNQGDKLGFCHALEV